MTKKTTLQFKEGNSDKTYEVWLEATPSGKSYKVNFAYGRTGGNLKAGTKTPRAVALEKAEEVFGKLVAEKKKKGYKAKRGKAPAKKAEKKQTVKKPAGKGKREPTSSLRESCFDDEGQVLLSGMLHGADALRLVKEANRVEGLCDDLELVGITALDVSATKALSKYKGSNLLLPDLAVLPDNVALAISKFQGNLELYGFKTITDKAAQALSRFKGGTGKTVSHAATDNPDYKIVLE